MFNDGLLLIKQSRDGSSMTDDWRNCPRTLEELEAILKARNEAALTHEKSLAFAFSQQVLFLFLDSCFSELMISSSLISNMFCPI